MRVIRIDLIRGASAEILDGGPEVTSDNIGFIALGWCTLQTQCTDTGQELHELAQLE